jgi:hypothetical protein
MKTLFIISGLLLTACVPQSNLVADRDGYTLQLDDHIQEIKAGESLTLTVNILRSKLYLDKPIKLKLSSPLPDGVRYVISPNPIRLDSGTIEFITSQEVRKGMYSVVLSGDAITSSIPSKGIVFKLSIN